MDLGLQGKVALVVAASKGLGFAAARQLAREGAKVAICSRSAERVDAAVARIKEEVGAETAVAGFVTDVTDAAQLTQLITDTVAHFGGLDILITNAGGPPGGTFESTDITAWEKAFNLTLMSVTHLIKAALPYLRQSDAASILTVTSISVKQPIGGLLLSNVLRPGVVGLTKVLSQELGPENIRVNSILPGWTATERVGEILDYRANVNESSAAAEEAKITRTIPMGRMGQPEEFGNVAAFLVSPAASYINGVMLHVDGGSYAGLL
ncbi:MAG: SDR family oxidoreductase [Ardenticatenaceae bacterium]|nr:SDR family oxidoreductase [Ardenticatenaceae bacterium]